MEKENGGIDKISAIYHWVNSAIWHTMFAFNFKLRYTHYRSLKIVPIFKLP